MLSLADYPSRPMPPEKTLHLLAGQPVTLLARAAPPADMTGSTLAMVDRDAIAGTVVLTKTTGITFSTTPAAAPAEDPRSPPPTPQR